VVRTGTSRAAKAPPSRKWNNVIATLKATDRNAASVLNVSFGVAVKTLPTIDLLARPILYGISTGLRFVGDTKQQGMSSAVATREIPINERYAAPSIANGLWNIASFEMAIESANSSFGRLAERAFKNTLNYLMSKGSPANQNVAERNLREFLEAQGDGGLVRLLVSNYLFELSLYYLHSGKNPSSGIKEDTGYRFYIDGRDRVLDPEKIEKFKQELRSECEKKAVAVVNKLKEMELFGPLANNRFSDPKVSALLREAFEEITKGS